MSVPMTRMREAVGFALATLLRAEDVRKEKMRALVVAAAAMKASAGEGWAEGDAALVKLEAKLSTELLTMWAALELRMLDLIAPRVLLTRLGDGTLGYRIDALSVLSDMIQNEALFVNAAGAKDGPLVRRAFAAWVRGLENAKADAGVASVDEVLDSVRVAFRRSLETRGLELVRNAAVRRFREPIVQALVNGEFDGFGPAEVARKLKMRFDAGDYDWQRLATSEIAMAQVDGKLEQYKAMGITTVDYVTARDNRVSKICRENAANNPYPIDDAPVPVRDSHPGCRCTIRAVADSD